MAEIKKEDLCNLDFHMPNINPYLAYTTPIVLDPSRKMSMIPSISEVDLPTFEELTFLRYEGCPGCGASRVKGKECEYCGRKH